MNNSEKLKILWARIDALEQLLVCYRVGKRPSEKLFTKLNRTEKDIKNNVLELYVE